jgi:AraC-like DNA-binding protein
METDDAVGTIGYRCGFATPAHFVNHFRTMNGVPPGRFRSIVRM